MDAGLTDGKRWIEAARGLAPRIRAASAALEEERRLPPALVRDLVDAGLFHLLVPRSLGGAELDLPTFAAVVEELARADASVAWCIGQASGCSMTLARLSKDVAREVLGADGRGIIAWGPGPGAFAVATAGGYRLTGEWSFASGVRHATWLGPSAPVREADGTPRRGPNGRPEVRTFLFPAPSARLVDVWHVSGLRGTGSDSFAVTDLFVPERHTVLDEGRATRVYEDGPLYRLMTAQIFPSAFASVALGTARAVLDAFAELAGGKVVRGGRDPLRESAVAQLRVGEAEAEVRAARAFLHQTLGAVWAEVEDGELTLEGRVLLRLAATHAIHRAARALDLIYHQAGSSAIFERHPFERRFRDLHAVTQQVQGREAHYQTAGQFFLGLEPDQTWL